MGVALNLCKERIQMALPALIIIDMQRGICEPSAGTRNNPQAEHVIAQLLQAWRQARAPLPPRARRVR